MKKTVSVLLAVILLAVSLGGCGNGNGSAEATTEEPVTQEPEYSPVPFSNVIEGVRMTDDELRAVISRVPSDRYERYPDMIGAPLTATLYKNGVETPIAVNNPRLIQLVNLYHNSVYYSDYSYTQGLLGIENIEAAEQADYRLVLTYTPYGDSSSTLWDTVIVTDRCFVVTNHELSGYDGLEDQYPYYAFGHCPLHDFYNWLDLFGF